MDFFLISYDIRNPKRLKKVAKVLENAGERVQYSIFEVWADAKQLEKLLSHLRRLMDPHTDSLRVYRLCAACRKTVVVFGQGEKPLPPSPMII